MNIKNVLFSFMIVLPASLSSGLEKQKKQLITLAMATHQLPTVHQVSVQASTIVPKIKKRPDLTIEIPQNNFRKSPIPTPEPLSPESHAVMVKQLFLQPKTNNPKITYTEE